MLPFHRPLPPKSSVPLIMSHFLNHFRISGPYIILSQREFLFFLCIVVDMSNAIFSYTLQSELHYKTQSNPF